MPMEHWKITEEKVQAAVQRIIEIAKPISIILFGSYVWKKIGPDSDLDILIVVDDGVENCRAESVRIRRELRNISMAFDILVIRQSDLDRVADVPGLIYETVLKEGEIVYEEAA